MDSGENSTTADCSDLKSFVWVKMWTAFGAKEDPLLGHLQGASGPVFLLVPYDAYVVPE